MLKMLKRAIPTPVKQLLKDKLLNLVNQTPHSSWDYLKQKATGSIFSPPGPDAYTACEKIKEFYKPLLQKHYIDFEEFFAGSIKNGDAAVLYDIILKRQPALVYHVGTFVGYSTMIIADALKQNGKGRIITVDPEIPHRTKTNPVNIAKEYAQLHGYNNISFIRGFNACVLGDDYFSETFKRKVPIVGYEHLHQLESPIDFAFIDGDHSTMATICDFLLVKDFLSLGGVIVFHDAFTWKTVTKAIEIICDDEYFLRHGTSRYFAMDIWDGPDGLAAFEKTTLNTNPLCKISICDAQSRQPVKDALVCIPSYNYKTLTSYDGVCYIFNEIFPDTKIDVVCAGYLPYSGNLDISTNSDYIEVIININPG